MDLTRRTLSSGLVRVDDRNTVLTCFASIWYRLSKFQVRGFSRKLFVAELRHFIAIRYSLRRAKHRFRTWMSLRSRSGTVTIVRLLEQQWQHHLRRVGTESANIPNSMGRMTSGIDKWLDQYKVQLMNQSLSLGARLRYI